MGMEWNVAGDFIFNSLNAVIFDVKLLFWMDGGAFAVVSSYWTNNTDS